MLFNSWQFAVFLPIVFALYWSLPHKFRWILLLIVSYWFYMSWNVKYIVLILFTTVISYLSAILIERYRNHGKIIMITALISCLGVLFVFKYFNFVSQSVADFLHMFAIPIHPMTLKLMLPVGISFYTFQTLGYVIDVYRGDIQAEHHFGIYAAFISFFPQLVAGPIERTNNLLPQIKAVHTFSYDNAAYGLKLMAWGFFKKLCVADVLAVNVDKVFSDLHSYEGFALIMAAIFFSIQIYCDFSGYSDIARGCSKLFGIELMQNFRSPYFSSSLKEFWQRWHISLSTWFRDYVYIPLGGNRRRHYVNLIITFMISGLWHGASWTFVVWGAVHGIAQVIEDFLGLRNGRNILRMIAVFGFTCLAWVFFRAQSLNDAVYFFTHIFTRTGKITSMGDKKLALFLALILGTYDFLSLKYDVIAKISLSNLYLRWLVYNALIVLTFFMYTNLVVTSASFIYFQF